MLHTENLLPFPVTTARLLAREDASNVEGVVKLKRMSTVEFTRLGRCFLDWATAVAGEADRELTCVPFTCHSSGPINLENIGPI